jgi:hypothetical protein
MVKVMVSGLNNTIASLSRLVDKVDEVAEVAILQCAWRNLEEK